MFATLGPWFVCLSSQPSDLVVSKLLGKNVSSQDQVGGPQIMVPNGVKHQAGPTRAELQLILCSTIDQDVSMGCKCANV